MRNRSFGMPMMIEDDLESGALIGINFSFNNGEIKIFGTEIASKNYIGIVCKQFDKGDEIFPHEIMWLRESHYAQGERE